MPTQSPPKTRRARAAVRCFALLAVAAALAACSSEGLQAKRQDTDAERKLNAVRVPVEAVPPVRGDVSAYFETTTRVEAERRVDVSAEAVGKCVEVLVEEGDRVAQGDVLAQLDKAQAEAALHQAEVLVRQTKASYELAKKQSQEGHGTRVETDNAYYQYEKSLADLEMQKVQLKNLTIRAPIAGIVTERDVQNGMYVSTGNHAFTIVDPDSFILVINPPEKELARLSVGQEAEVHIDALRGREFAAKIRRINPAVDSASGTVKVTLDFEQADRQMLPESAFARVKLVMATRKNVLLVPKEAVLEENGRRFVFVVKPDGSAGDPDHWTAERVEVGVGLEDTRRIQIFNGLSDEDLVVVNGQHSLKAGAAVKVTNVGDELRVNAELSEDEALAAARLRRESEEKDDTRRRNIRRDR